ncbi:hypothetical protein LJR225_004684 [Phenylobacterium sp. LjRoot225]|uniref:beta-1,6-N-acetylglucosaminyltransferase n=1 Tax=Phenylobacterium sp. LjRoot225 TaxID=3342285 RepID=UPI003ECCBCBE
MTFKPKPAYIVLAHKRPDLLSRLVEALDPAPIAVHIDGKADVEPFREAVKLKPDVTFLPRHVCHWGLYGHVAASLEGLKWFLTTDASHAILATGQCYPLVPQQEIEQHLANLGERSQMRMLPFPIDKWGPRGGFERIDRHYFHRGGVKPKALKLLPRKVPGGLHPHGGQSYWCLSRKHAEHLLGYLEQNRKVARFFSTAFAPDEMMIQTILANSPFSSDVVRTAFNYSTFEPGASNPAVLKAADFDAARASGALFARKFEDHEVLDALDASIGAKSPVPARVSSAR